MIWHSSSRLNRTHLVTMFTKLVLILLILQPMTSLAESHLEDAEPDPRSRLIRLVLMELRRQENVINFSI